MSGSLRCCVRWTELVAVARVCVCSCVRRRGRLAELGGGWCVLVRAPGLADDSVREVRLARVIVAVAVRLCEACRRPFWVGLVWGYGVGVEGAEMGCGCVVVGVSLADVTGGAVGWGLFWYPRGYQSELPPGCAEPLGCRSDRCPLAGSLSGAAGLECTRSCAGAGPRGRQHPHYGWCARSCVGAGLCRR